MHALGLFTVIRRLLSFYNMADPKLVHSTGLYYIGTQPDNSELLL
jgi:hypothetical protein